MSAVLWSFDPGTMGGPAIVDTLFGDSVPSGKLTVTFPRTVGQCPIYYDHMNTGRPAWVDGPASKDKYTSKYVDVSFTPEYPFGYGLSYTHFLYANLHLSSDQMKMGGDLQISADVTNTGSVKADEVVQLYTRQMAASLTRPVRELRSFQRIHLDPGQTQTVQFPLKSDDLAFYNAQGTLAAEPGDFQVWIAPDSASGIMGRFSLAK
jgi:beta-glucosidase